MLFILYQRYYSECVGCICGMQVVSEILQQSQAPRSELSVMALCFHFDFPVPRSELSVMALCFHFDIKVPRSELSVMALCFHFDIPGPPLRVVCHGPVFSL